MGVRDNPAQVFPAGEINTPPLLPGESPTTPRVADLHFLLDCLPALNFCGPLAGTFDLRRAAAVLAPVLTAFFDAALCEKPPAERLNAQPDDWFAARQPGC